MPQLQCPGCTRQDHSKRLITLQSGRDIRRCKQCSLVFVDPMPTRQEIADYYQGFTFGMPAPEAVEAHQTLISANVARIVEDLGAIGCHFGSALDFGGGLGYYANAFAEYFDTVDMFDLDRVSLEHAHKLFPDRFGLHTTEAGEVPHFGRKYDVVFANQVIEHYTDLNLFFATIHAAAHEDTIFVVTTPNNRSREIWVRPEMLAHYSGIGARNIVDRFRVAVSLARDSWACCDPPRHVFAFDPKNLSTLAERHALEALRVSTIYCTDDYYSPAKYGPIPVRNIKTVFRAVFNAAIRAAVRLVQKFDPTIQHGDNVVLLARVAPNAPSE